MWTVLWKVNFKIVIIKIIIIKFKTGCLSTLNGGELSYEYVTISFFSQTTLVELQCDPQTKKCKLSLVVNSIDS
jgi:hypothetical protein